MEVALWLRRHGDIHTPEPLDAIYEAARRIDILQLIWLRDLRVMPFTAVDVPPGPPYFHGTRRCIEVGTALRQHKQAQEEG